MRYACKDDPFSVAIDGYCDKCKHYMPIITELIGYHRSFANSTPETRAHYMNVKCKKCTDGFLDFEFIDYNKFILQKVGENEKKRHQVSVKVSEGEVDTLGTVFNKVEEGYYTSRSTRLQAILEFLLNNYNEKDIFFKKKK